jgi:hypothetical protein
MSKGRICWAGPTILGVAAGLAPREFRSGGERARADAVAQGRERAAAQGAISTHPDSNPVQPVLRGFFARLVTAGKPKMQAVSACRRKLVTLCYGVLQNRAPFDPAWSSRTTP